MLHSTSLSWCRRSPRKPFQYRQILMQPPRSGLNPLKPNQLKPFGTEESNHAAIRSTNTISTSRTSMDSSLASSQSGGHYDLIIVGAGISGLSAAYNVLTKRPSTKVLILESRDRIGGRIYPMPVIKVNGKEGSVDLGASFIHGVNGNPTMAIAKKLGLKLKFNELNIRAIDSNGKEFPPETVAQVAPKVFGTLFEWLPAIAQGDPEHVPDEKVSLADRVYSKSSPIYDEGDDEHETPAIAREPSQESPAIEKEDTEVVWIAKTIIRCFQGWTGAPLDLVSLKWWGFNQDTDGGDALLVEGYVQILNWLKAEIERMGGIIKLGERVDKVNVNEESHVELITPNSSHRAPLSLLTLPLGVLKHRPPEFNPPLPLRRLQATERLGFGLLDKVVLIYDHPWWSSKDMSVVEDEDSNAPITNILIPSKSDPTRLMGPTGGRIPSHSPNPLPGAFPERTQEYLSKHPNAGGIFDIYEQNGVPALSMFIGGENGDVLERCTDEEVAEWADGVIRSYFSPSHAQNQQQRSIQKPIPVPIRVERTRWRADEDSFGSYSYIPVGGSPTSNSTSASIAASPVDQLELSRTLWGRVFWAGEHTHLDQYASVHGAWNSGLREAEKIVTKLESLED